LGDNNNGKHLGRITPTPTYIIQPTTTPTQTPTPTPTETPVPTPRPVPHGKQTFYTWFGSAKGQIDPYDPAVGSTQSVQLQLVDSRGITEVNVIVTTDAACTAFPLSLSSGTSMEGIWTGWWTVVGSYDFTYLMSILVTNTTGAVFRTDLTLR